MAVQVGNVFRYPLLSFGVLILLIIPAYQLFMYFFPLFVSTALCVAAIVTVGPTSGGDSGKSEDKSWLERVKLSLRAWLARFRSKERLDTPEECSVESVHEERVHQLEKTLRTLSFVSYEGMFEDIEGISQEVDGMPNEGDGEHKEEGEKENMEDPNSSQHAEQNGDCLIRTS